MTIGVPDLQEIADRVVGAAKTGEKIDEYVIGGCEKAISV